MYCVITLYSIMLSYSHLLPTIKQDGSHEPECIHVLGLRVQTSAIGKRFFFHASCVHIVSAKALEQQFTKRQLTSTTTSPPAQRNHHQHNNITSATKSPAQQNHQRSEVTSTTNAPANITSATKSPAQRNHQRTTPAHQNHQNKRNS